MGDARKTAAASGGILDRIASSLVANDHEFRMAHKVEQLISSAAPGLESIPCPSQYGQLHLDDVTVKVEPIDRQGRPTPTVGECRCSIDHPEILELAEKIQFPVLRIVRSSTGAHATRDRYIRFAYYGTPPMTGYSYDEIEGAR